MSEYIYNDNVPLENMRYVSVQQILERIKNQPQNEAVVPPEADVASAPDGPKLAQVKQELDKIALAEPKLATACKILNKKIIKAENENEKDGIVSSEEIAQVLQTVKNGSHEHSVSMKLLEKFNSPELSK